MVQIIGRTYRPYKIIGWGHDEPLMLKILTMVEPTTGWFYILQYNNKQTYQIENLVDQA